MKKLSKKQREWQKRHARKRFRKELRRKQRRDEQRKSGFRRLPSPPKRRSWEERVIIPPATFDLDTNHEAVATFLQDMRSRVLFNDPDVVVDLRTIEKLSPSGALILAAELDRWRQRGNKRLKPFKIGEWDPYVSKLLTDLGLFDLLQVNSKKIPRPSSEMKTRYFKFRSGSAVGKDMISELTDDMAQTTDLPASEHLLGALDEVVFNSIEHAYDRKYRAGYPRDKKSKRVFPLADSRWWLSGSYSSKERRITIHCYDQGVGIPYTLPKNRWISKMPMEFLKRLAGLDDGQRIMTALELGASSTGRAFRGKGLHDVLQYAEITKGELKIFSNHGYCGYTKADGYDNHHHEQSIGGTLVEWKIWL